MRIALVVVGLLAVSVAAYVLLFPRDTSISCVSRGGGGITFSRTGVSFDAAPDHYATNGLDQIERYISRLLVPSNRLKSLSIFSPDGDRGFGFRAKDGVVYAGLTVACLQDPQREAAIRIFFGSLGIPPAQDYLTANGGVPDATRILEYPVFGSAADVTALTRRILLELCAVTPTEALDFRYED